MIATIGELRDAKAILAEGSRFSRDCPNALRHHGGNSTQSPSWPTFFAEEADFFSIGTNDLTQYTLAMDRGHPRLAPKVDALNPGLLRLIAQTVEGARKHNRFTGVCGGIAGDAQAVPILVGLGGRTERPAASIPTIKAQVRRLSYADCWALAQRVSYA